MSIIGISGQLGSGKDTLARMIIENDNRFIQKSFAFKLKQIVSIISGTSLEDNLSQEGKKKISPIFNLSLGEMQQIIGTKVFRDNFDEDIWIKALFSDYDPKKDFWVISDVRFKNEAKYIKSLNGLIVRIEGDPAEIRKNSNRDLNHPSETELNNYQEFDFKYLNNKSLKELESFAKTVLPK